MSLQAFLSVGVFFILPAAAFVIGAAGFFIRTITWHRYLVGGLSFCVVIPVGAYFLMGVLGALAQPHDKYGDRTNLGATGMDGMDVWVVAVVNALFGAVMVVLMTGLLALCKAIRSWLRTGERSIALSPPQ